MNAITVIQRAQNLLNFVMPLLVAIAVVWFVWGVIQYTMSSEEDKKKAARGKIINGLIGLFIILAFWGIVYLIVGTFGVGPDDLRVQDIPCIPVKGGPGCP